MGEMDRNPLLDPQPPDVLTDAMQEYGERGQVHTIRLSSLYGWLS
jgi:hypothetical protein